MVSRSNAPGTSRALTGEGPPRGGIQGWSCQVVLTVTVGTLEQAVVCRPKRFLSGYIAGGSPDGRVSSRSLGLHAFVRALLTSCCLLMLATAAPGPAFAQDAATVDRAAAALAQAMSPDERVGQLLLVPFAGSSADDQAAIVRLVVERHVGGVILDAASGNFTSGADAPAQVARMANALQTRFAQSHANFVPLFISLSPGGDGLPGLPADLGLPPMPSQMSIGATWDPQLAGRAGDAAGRRLAAMGVNLLLGPDLDVHPGPRAAGTGDLGIASFGGSPAWVGRFGREFIRGLHQGSGGKVAAAVGSFPGAGAADRSQADAIAVVERPFEQLARTDLVPFLAVTTHSAEDPAASADALRSSRVRYRGIQSQPERPFALDGSGLRYLEGQADGLAEWRAGGGLRVSPGLGLPAFRAYASTGEATELGSRRVIREALVAGHDLLDLSGLDTADGQGVGPTVAAQEIGAGIQWLTDQYASDAELRRRVDEALLQVLRLKLRQHGPAPVLEAVLVDREPPDDDSLSSETSDQVARAALTRVSPSEGTGLRSPQPGDKIVWVVDARERRDCPNCELRLRPDPLWLLDGTRQIYGPKGAGLARLRDEEDVAAITFRDMKLWLQEQGLVRPESTLAFEKRQRGDRPWRETDRLITGADWLVFCMRDLNAVEAASGDALRLFLKARPASPEGQRRVVFALEAPYHLDTTEIAGLEAFYALYAPSRPFVQVAIRALFGDAGADGASPVSIPGAGYDLDERLLPDAEQRLQLEPVGWSLTQGVPLGATFRVRTSPIADRNGNPVSDGTRITFRRFVRSDNAFLQDVTVTVENGRAEASIRAEREGVLELSAVQDNLTLSEPLELSVEPASILAPVWSTGGIDRPRYVDWGIFLLSMSLILLGGVLVYGVNPGAARAPTRLVRLFLLSLGWGLAGYLLVAAGGITLELLPGGARLWPAGWRKAYQAPVLSFICALLPVLPTLVRGWRPGGRDDGS